MSKIEEALKKARSLESKGPVGALARSPFQADPQPAQAGPARIRQMEEEWRRLPAELAERRIIHPEMADKQVLNAFRQLRTQVLDHSGKRGSVVMVLSTADHGGSSFVATNLAAAIALDENHTALAVDCNLNDPALHQLLREGEGAGLSDYLSTEEMKPDEIIHHCGVPRLRVVPAGREAKARGELFSLQRMRQLISALKARYPDRYLVLDAPPLSQAADVRILEQLADYVLLVVPYGRNTEQEVQRAVATIPRQKLVGVVFNDEPRIGMPVEP